MGIIMTELPIPAACEISWRRGRGSRRLDEVRFEGADGNVRASRVGKETLAGSLLRVFSTRTNSDDEQPLKGRLISQSVRHR
jgi:hypothetical protein